MMFTWVAELVFGERFLPAVVALRLLLNMSKDTVIFIATTSRTLVTYMRYRHSSAVPLIKIMMRDGTSFLSTFVAYTDV